MFYYIYLIIQKIAYINFFLKLSLIDILNLFLMYISIIYFNTTMFNTYITRIELIL